MEVIYLNHASKQFNSAPHVMAIGFFDGVHLGHQELLNRARTLAEKNNALFTAMTFSPHPDEVIKGDKNRKYITPLSAKIEKMAAVGVDKLFVMEFDKDFASLPPADFINEYITETNAIHVVVGFDFTFGFKAQGDTLMLHEESKQGGFGLSVIPKKTYLDEKISSTKLREMISEGEVEMVPYYLGAHHKVKVTPDLPGTPAGFKIRMAGSYIVPNPGIYHVEVSDGEKTVHGELLKYSNCETDMEIIASGQLNCNSEELSVVFLSKVSSKASVMSI